MKDHRRPCYSRSALRYLHYTLYCRGGTGLSNLVISAEVGVVLAHLTERTLVLEGNRSPPANIVQYGDGAVSHPPAARITDLLELPVPWLEADDVDLDGHERRELVDDHQRNAVFYWPPGDVPSGPDFRRFAHRRNLFATETDELREVPVLAMSGGPASEHWTRNLSFYSYFFYLDPPTRRSVHALLRRMRPKTAYADLAAQVAASLGTFNAVHVRRGDFKATYGVTTLGRQPREVIDALAPHCDPCDPLAILTDEADDAFFAPVLEHYPRAVFLDRYILEHHRDAFLALPHRDAIVLAFVSQLVAAYSRDFVGTMTSTYTSLVQRYRGNRGSAEPFKFLWNEIPDKGTVVERGRHPPSTCVPLDRGVMAEEHEGPYSWNRYNPRINPAWMREWPESFLLDADEATETIEMSDEDSAASTRDVAVQIHLTGGHTCRSTLPSDSELLRDLFTALAAGPAGEPRLFQVPLYEGTVAYTFSSAQLVAVVTEPPVLVADASATSTDAPPDPARVRPTPEPVVRPAPRPVSAVRPSGSDSPASPHAASASTSPARPQLPFAQVDALLTPDEHRQLIEHALAAEASFARDGVDGYRAAAVLPAFAESPLSDVIANRLRLLLPQVEPTIDMERLRTAEMRLELTAHYDGDVLTPESATAMHGTPADVVCAYHFHRQPRPFSGGEYRLRDEAGTGRHLIEPRDNGVLVFRARALEEILPLASPTQALADCRFSITARVDAARP